MNLGNDYEEAPNVEVINQSSTVEDHRENIPSSIESISGKIITE